MKPISFKQALLAPTLVALTISLSACAGGGGGGWKMPPPLVETTSAMKEPWTVTYTATGTLEANNKADLNTETPGNVTAILVKEGQPVSRGQVLIRLKADKQLAQLRESAAGISASMGNVEQQHADIRQAQARLNSAASRRQLAQSELHRYEKLFKDEFISQLELDQKRNAYDVADAAYNEAIQGLSSAKAQSRQAVSNLAQAKSNYNYNLAMAGEASIRAPFSGIVGQKYVDVGDYASPSQKLITVVDPSTFKVEFTVPERYLSQVHPGLSVQAQFEGLGKTTFSGVVNFIDPVIDMQAHTVTMKARIPGAPQLRHGLLGSVELSLGLIPNAVVIPEEALVPQGEKTFVYVVRHEAPPAPSEKAAPAGKQADSSAQLVDIAHLQEVQVGYRRNGRVQIDSGLAPGEAVIINGLQKVSDKLEVNVKKPGDASSAPAGKGQ